MPRWNQGSAVIDRLRPRRNQSEYPDPAGYEPIPDAPAALTQESWPTCHQIGCRERDLPIDWSAKDR